MYIILNFLWNSIRATLKKRLLVIDEAWNLLQYEDSARFLYGLIKSARKYYLGVTTITQDVEDFINSPYGKPIITNSAFQILLKQSASAVDNLQKLFYLTDGEKSLLMNSGIGQGLFFAGNKHVAIQIVASPEEERLITTKPNEVLAQQKKDDAAEVENAKTHMADIVDIGDVDSETEEVKGMQDTQTESVSNQVETTPKENTVYQTPTAIGAESIVIETKEETSTPKQSEETHSASSTTTDNTLAETKTEPPVPTQENNTEKEENPYL